MKQEIGSVIGYWGAAAVCLAVGILHLRTLVRRRNWPLVNASLKSIDGQVDVTTTGEFVGVQPRFNHQMLYTYDGRVYSLPIADRKLLHRGLGLRVNPQRPEEAYPEDSRWFIPVLLILTGIVLVAIAMASAV